MKSIADLSVGISTRNRPQVLGRCLEHLLSADKLPAEIVVVDQSSDDQTRDIVTQRPSTQTEIRYIGHSGSGLGKAQNIVFKNATCPIVAVTDDDCIPQPDWVAVLERVFALSERIDGVTGRVLPLGPEEEGRYAIASRTSQKRVTFVGKAPPWEVGSGNNFAVKRAWLDRIGGNDERLGPGSPGQGGVDMDLFYRLLRAGARIRYEPDLLVYHERTDRAGRISRRGPYGYGMGACCMLWLAQGDSYAANIFVRWLFMRLTRLGKALLTGKWMMVQEETLILNGTFRGLFYGLQANKKTAMRVNE